MLGLSSSGSFNNVEKYLKKLAKTDLSGVSVRLDTYGKMGVDALASATPVESGLTARSWRYRIVSSKNGPTLEWYNTNVRSGVNVAILIQYGHGTKNGGYVQGIDYINPAIRPIFNKISDEVMKEVSRG